MALAKTKSGGTPKGKKKAKKTIPKGKKKVY